MYKQSVTAISAGGKTSIQQLNNDYAFYWIKNMGEAAIYATNTPFTDSVSDVIAAYEAGDIAKIVKIDAGEATRIDGHTESLILFAAAAGLAEVHMVDMAESPFV